MRPIDEVRPVVLVTRATCIEGGSVLRRLRARGRCAVRAMTRVPASPAACALARDGVDVVRGDLEDLDSLTRAMAGCWGIAGIVRVDDRGSCWRQACNLLDAGADAGVGLVVLGVLDGAVSGRSTSANQMARIAGYASGIGVPLTFRRLEDSGPAVDVGDAIAAAFER